MNVPQSKYNSVVIVYKCESHQFHNLNSAKELLSVKGDTCSVDQLLSNDFLDRKDAESFRRKLAEASVSCKPYVSYMKSLVKSAEGKNVFCQIGFVCSEPKKNVAVIFTFMNAFNESAFQKLDQLTGIYTRAAFVKEADCWLEKLSEEDLMKTVMIYFDVQRFKIINEMFGMEEGDRLLIHIADAIAKVVENNGIACRIGSDRFCLITKTIIKDIPDFIENIFENISSYPLSFEIACNAGIYLFNGKLSPADSAIGRAIMAQSPIKGSYTQRYNYYTETLRSNLLTEQEITGLMRAALEEEQFVICYQPQYNHSTGMLVGAEALVRWNHPEKGLISPGVFIPVFEKNGFITALDLYVFDKVCQYIRKCMNEGSHIVPISVNLTRYDIFSPDFIDKLEQSRMKYNVPSKYIRIEITESAALGNSQFINEAVRKLHSYGYIVEMDDFGSGYSSLNILKDIDFDIIKLDMRFLQNENDTNNRGGTILSSVVRMVNWLGLPVIAEGVEIVEQADFLRSIGCNYIQGYLYSRPLPEDEYHKLLCSGGSVGITAPQMRLLDTMNAANFWSSDSMETLIFSNFVGGAAIFDYHDGKTELLRVNKKYLQEICMNLSENEIVNTDIMDWFDEEGKNTYRSMLELAIETEDEQEAETWRHLTSSICGEDDICVRSTVRMIGKSKNSCLFYAMIRNITAEKNYYSGILDTEKRFKIASEQVDMYFWEYTVATKEMRPCFRCMKNLGLPPLLKNYPESAIEMGIFPPEVADMYRDWHKQIAEGVESLEAVIPLTADRIPFRVRYTTEFDETGRPVKAYASATLVVD